MDELKEDMDIIWRQITIRSESSIDGYTRTSINNRSAFLRGKLVTVKLLEGKLDEINFSQDLRRENFSQRLENVEETIHARLRMQQVCIGNLQKRMHVNEVDNEIMKNNWTRGYEAIRISIGTWFQMRRKDADTCFLASSQSPPY